VLSVVLDEHARVAVDARAADDQIEISARGRLHGIVTT
jgi:hypothetical protein